MEISLYSYGGHSEGETPGPIPNPEAKPFSADGTALVTVWESRTPPDIYCEKSPHRAQPAGGSFAFAELRDGRRSRPTLGVRNSGHRRRAGQPCLLSRNGFRASRMLEVQRHV